MTHLRRRSTAVTAATLLLAAPLLSSCGFDLATDRINTISAGINDRGGDVDILGAVVIAGQDDVGVFAASFVNNASPSPQEIADEGALAGVETLTSLGTGPVGSAGDVAPIGGDIDPIEVEPRELVNLFEEGAIPVQGDFAAGDFVAVNLTFSGGQTSTLQVPVVPACFQYDIDTIDLPGSGVGDVYADIDPDTPEDEQQAELDDSVGPNLYDCETLDSEHYTGEEEGEESEESEGLDSSITGSDNSVEGDAESDEEAP